MKIPGYAGNSGEVQPAVALLTLADYEAAAKPKLDPVALGYFAGGAGDEHTLRGNDRSLAALQLRPRVLVDVASATTESTLMGEAAAAPSPSRPRRTTAWRTTRGRWPLPGQPPPRARATA